MIIIINAAYCVCVCSHTMFFVYIGMIVASEKLVCGIHQN